MVHQAALPGSVMHDSSKPPAAAAKAAKGKRVAAAAAGSRGGVGASSDQLLLHVAVPSLAALAEQRQQAEQASTAAAAAALAGAAEGYLAAYGTLKCLMAAVAELDVLAGFAQAVSDGGAAPPGCSFCRPVFAAARAGSSGEAAAARASSSPLLRLEGLWHPLLAVCGSGGAVLPNDVHLGRDVPGAMLLTGALVCLLCLCRPHNSTPRAGTCLRAV
jgi:hypothetical protein